METLPNESRHISNGKIAEPRVQAWQGSRYRDPVHGEEAILLKEPPQAQCTLQYVHNMPITEVLDNFSNLHTSIGKTTHKAER